MTIEQAYELYKKEINGELSAGEDSLFFGEEESGELSELLTRITALFIKEDCPLVYRLFLHKFAKKYFQNSPCVKNFKGKGTANNPYYIETVYGSGLFYDAHCIFEKHKYLNEIKRHQCWTNNLYFLHNIKNLNIDAELVSGIAQHGNSYLCSVVLAKIHNGQYVVDFDHDVVMEYKLFYNLFNFKEKCRVHLQTLIDDNILNYPKIDGLNLYLLCMAYNEMVGKIKSGEVQVEVNCMGV